MGTRASLCQKCQIGNSFVLLLSSVPCVFCSGSESGVWKLYSYFTGVDHPNGTGCWDKVIHNTLKCWSQAEHVESVLTVCVFVRVCRLTGQVADDPVTDVSEICRLESTHPKMSFTCRFRRAFLTVISRVFLITVGEISHTTYNSRLETWGLDHN